MLNDEQFRQDIIDEDLYEEIDDDEMYRLVEEGRSAVLAKEREDRLNPKPKTPIPKWAFWLIAVMLILNVVALLPKTFSVPAIDFLTMSAKLSTQEDIKTYKEAVVVVETRTSKGTGFTISEDGYILTNHHVIEGEKSVTIAFPEDGLFKANVVHTYPDVDLAILKIDNQRGLPFLTLASHLELNEGEAVYFIGNPLLFHGIANEGKMLGSIKLNSWEEDVIMLDAPVYRGNSGSPVINRQGEVIGVIFATLDHEKHGKVGLFFPIDYYYKYHQ